MESESINVIALVSAECPLHGKPANRDSRPPCDEADMRGRHCKHQRETPAYNLWDQARSRAQRHNVHFSLDPDQIVIPDRCPVLGISLKIGGRRSDRSPSLDRINPAEGYVPGNVRVISDKANRLKGNRTIKQLLNLALKGRKEHRDDFVNILVYLNREQFLADIRAKATNGGRVGNEWMKIERALQRLFSRG
jgi:hypothetical protein